MEDRQYYQINPLDVYAELSVDAASLKRRNVDDVYRRAAVRKYLYARGFTLREIGAVEGIIRNGEPTHHSSILSANKQEDYRVASHVSYLQRMFDHAFDNGVEAVKALSEMKEKSRLQRVLQKQRDAAKKKELLDIKKAMREAGAIPAAGAAARPSFQEVTGINPHIYTGAFGAQLMEAARQYEEKGSFDRRLLIQGAGATTVSPVRADVEGVKSYLSQDHPDQDILAQRERNAPRVVQKRPSLLKRMANFFFGEDW